jgi:hypothetical protein
VHAPHLAFAPAGRAKQRRAGYFYVRLVAKRGFFVSRLAFTVIALLATSPASMAHCAC